MNLTIEIPDDKTAALLAKATTLGVSAEQYVERMVNEDLEESSEGATKKAPRRHIAEVIREIWRDLPDEARAKLPTDGAAQVDHYVYGLPKKDQLRRFSPIPSTGSRSPIPPIRTTEKP